MNQKKLENLIKKNEGPKLDFKQIIELDMESSKKELAKDVCAIGNSKGGRGYIIIGIEDKTKKILGLNNINFTEEQIQQIITSRIDPPIPVSLEILKYKQKKLAIINIYNGDQKPYQVRERGAFYIRRGSTTDTMRKQEIISSLQDNFSLNVELCPIIRSNKRNISKEIVDKYFESMGVSINEENRMFLMENASIIHHDRESNKYNASLGGLLIFCKNNNIFLPHNIIKIINNVNKEFPKVIIVKGDLLSMVYKVKSILSKIFPYIYPTEAIYEAVNNAVIHRDYTMFYKEIEVIINFNNVIVVSPGCLLKGSNVRSLNTVRRNMWIYEKLMALDKNNIFTNSGNGFKKMRKKFKRKGKVVFINSLKENCFKVIFPGINKFKE
ncbi:AlbA family DNA-binding domain-containing protein [Clostridium oceanicum]|uniref:DNA binding domain-containing protein n=1 Tax=Clostridium oceanicum TaxID=1543 RepID=A0ABN1J9Z9_9CLOT